jgi:hypothetical protein
MASPLFTGESSLRDPRERMSFVLTLVFAFPIAYAIGLVIHEQIGPPEVALFIVIAMLYVTLARGRLIGSSVMIHEAQYPRVFSIVKNACAALEIPMPLVFVREDNQVPVVALGFGEPYALVISSHWIEHFEDDELAFAIGCELGHIAAGHTRFLSLLSVNGSENPVVALIFGAWLRSCSLTCDRIGLLVCGSVDAAARSIVIATFHHFGRRVDVKQFTEQGRQIASDGLLRLGEWLGADPYATRRIAMMAQFVTTPLYQNAHAWYQRSVPSEPPALVATRGGHVARADCAGFWRRAWSVLIDLTVVSTLVLAFNTAQASRAVQVDVDSAPATPAAHATAKPKSVTWKYNEDEGLSFAALPAPLRDAIESSPIGRAGAFILDYSGNGNLLLTALYLSVLVGLAGQSFGMMITGLRVVTTDFRAPGLWVSIWRYLVGIVLWPIILMCSPFMHRVMLHDRLSGTRLIRSERILERAVEATSKA